MLQRIAAGAALAVALALPMAGCAASTTNPGSPPASSPSPSVDPAKTLAAAVAKTKGINLKVVLAGDTPDEDVTGLYDAAHKIASIGQGTGAGALRIVLTPDDMYLGGLPDFKGKTVRLRIAKLRTESPLAVFADILSPLSLLDVASGVQATSSTAFAGTLDLSQVPAATAGTRKFLDHALKAGGTKAKSVAFNATVDGQGYLSEFQMTLPGIDNGKDADYRLTLSNFGQPVTVKRPTGKNVVEAPAAVYAQS